MTERLTRVLALALLVAGGVLLYVLGPGAAHDAASGLLGAAAAVGGGAMRRP